MAEMRNPGNSRHPRVRRTGIVPNGPKVREAILHVIREADSRDLKVSQFDILKSLFLADRAHLNKYGRPITFDEYVAMTDGPVAALAYDVLKGALEAFREAEIDNPLWKSEPDGGRKFRFYDAQRDASDDVLSESDVEELTRAIVFVKEIRYKGTWDHVHKDPAYIDAWNKRGSDQQHPIDMMLMMDSQDRDTIDNIKFASAHL